MILKIRKNTNKTKNVLQSLGGMSQGLFFTLIIGTIISQIGLLIGDNQVGIFVDNIGLYLKRILGVGIGLGIGLSLNQKGLKLLSITIMGFVSTIFKISFFHSSFYIPLFGDKLGEIGVNLDPLNIFLVTYIGYLILNKILVKKTPIDILLIPLLSTFIAVILTFIFSGISGAVLYYISRFIDISTKAVPLLMVIVISLSMGILLTSPLSSAAIGIMISLGSNQIAAAAAILGTTIQMIGLGFQGRKSNNSGVMISCMIGTSMFYFTNLIKKPLSWLPTLLTTILISPVVLSLGIEGVPSDIVKQAWTLGSGMGSSGLVGQIQTVLAMGVKNANTWLFIAIQIVASITLVYYFEVLFKRFNLISNEDLKIQLL